MSVPLDELSVWCARTLGAGIDQVLFETGFSSHVYGVRLRDGHDLVLKLRACRPRLQGTAEVHRRCGVADSLALSSSPARIKSAKFALVRKNFLPAAPSW